MYSIWKNGKCIKLYKTLKGAYRFYCSVIERCDESKDCVKLLNPEQEILYWY